MRLYSGTVNQFIADTVQNQIAEKLRTEFLNYYRHLPGNAEIQSWRNSLRALKDLIQQAGVRGVECHQLRAG